MVAVQTAHQAQWVGKRKGWSAQSDVNEKKYKQRRALRSQNGWKHPSIKEF